MNRIFIIENETAAYNLLKTAFLKKFPEYSIHRISGKQPLVIHNTDLVVADIKSLMGSGVFTAISSLKSCIIYRTPVILLSSSLTYAKCKKLLQKINTVAVVPKPASPTTIARYYINYRNTTHAWLRKNHNLELQNLTPECFFYAVSGKIVSDKIISPYA